MTDDDRLAELFRTAASDPDAPPPGSTTRTSWRRRGGSPRRRRSAVVGGAVAVLALVGVGAAVACRPTADRLRGGGAGRAGPSRRAPSAGRTRPPHRSGRRTGRREGAGSRGRTRGRSRPRRRRRPDPLGPGTGPAPTGRTRQLRASWSRCCPRWSAPRPRPTPTTAGPGGQRYVTLEVQDGAGPRPARGDLPAARGGRGPRRGRSARRPPPAAPWSSLAPRRWAAPSPPFQSGSPSRRLPGPQL